MTDQGGALPGGGSRDVQDIIPTRMAMTPAPPEPPPDESAPAEAATLATTPVAGDAPTRVTEPAADPAATRIADLRGDPGATRVTALAGADATRVTQPVADPEATRVTGGPSTSATGRPSTGGLSRSDAPTVVPGQEPGTDSSGVGSRRFTGTYTRLGRTRTNSNLPPDTQQLDLKLQLSRPSVLADMGKVGSDRLPPGIAKLIDEHGTEGRYAVEKPLAQGGMGAVLLIKDGDFQRPAAMKVMLSRFAKSPEALERFLAEAQVTAQLEHPNIVPIHDMGIMEDGTVYFTMKFVQGESLGAVVKRLKSDDPAVRDPTRALWSDERLLMTFLKVLEGVGYAHAKGVVHRDIKPDNIMLGGHGEVLVVDWGIAKVLGKDLAGESTAGVVQLRDDQALSHTVEGSAMGTLYYMPPEQATGDLARIGPHSDVYALGATLYELLTLKRPVTGASAADVLAKVVAGELTPVKEVRPDLPDDLAAITMKAMAHAPERRYATCSEFAEDIRRYLAGHAVAARRRNLVERVGAWVGRNKRKVIATAVAGACGAVVVVATIGVLRARDTRRADELIAKAQTLLEQKAWAGARDAAIAALAIRPGDHAGIDLRETAAAGLALEEQAERERIAREAAHKKAVALVRESTAAVAAGRWAEARDKAKAALENDASIAEAQDLLAKAGAELANAERAKLTAKAAELKTAGDALLARARALPALDAGLAPLLAQARETYAKATADGIAVAGVDEALAELGGLQAKATAAAAQKARDDTAAEAAAQRRKQADEAIAAAAAAIAKGDLDAAAEQVAAARKLEPTDERAAKLRDDLAVRIRDRDAERTRIAAREQARKTAGESLGKARAAEARMRTAVGELATASATAQRLSLELASLPAERKQPLTDARAAAARAEAAIAEQWALAEGAARGAYDALAAAGDAGSDDAKAARDLLVGLYQGRLADARARRALPEVAAFTNLLARLGADPAAASAGTLAITGPAGAKLSLTRLDEDGIGRLVPTGAVVAEATLPAAQPLALPAGRYQIAGGDQIAAVTIEPGTNAALAWAPGAAPAVAGQVLRWVPPVGEARGFWLAQDEVTVAQWAEFLADPAIFAEAKAAWKKAKETPDGSLGIILIPREGLLSPTWQVHVADEAELVLQRVDPREDAKPTSPVTGVSRADAQRFCAWLAAKSGRKVRLPAAAEWRRAADAGDGRRLYPWGPGFDWSLATTALPRRDVPPPVGSAAADRGPHGHRDLAGSVREWLADAAKGRDDFATAGVHGALIAGGSFDDEKPLQFQTTWTESVPPDYCGRAIGFRILVEP